MALQRILRPWMPAVCVLAAILFLSSGMAQPAANSPRLVLLIVVDQMRSDYLQRFEGRFQYGLKQLLDTSVRFENTFHEHAVTTTGPGHATIASGYFPRHSGIIDNAWYDRDKGSSVNCVEDDGVETLESSLPGRSPRNLLVSSLGDWIKQTDPESLVYGASRKDRAAILLAGRQADGAFWYGEKGGFVTSSYYFRRLPEWLEQFNEAAWPDRFFGTLWEPQHPLSKDLMNLGVKDLEQGVFKDIFPRAFGSGSLTPTGGFYAGFGASPMMDEYLAKLAMELLRSEALGKRGHLDMLAVGFSSLDSVGHSFGPNSPEVFDTLIRLDKTIGDLLKEVDRQVGLDRTLVVLSADHGVLPIPEDPSLREKGARRFDDQDIACFQRAGLALQEHFGEADWIESGFYFNYSTLGARDVRRRDLETYLANLLEKCEPVEKIWTRTELEGEPPVDPMGRLFWNSFRPDSSGDLMLQSKPWRLSISGRGTSHGSPYDYDRHVPFLFRAPGGTPRQVMQRVRTVDIAPTVAEWLGIPVPEDLDGRSLLQWIPHAPPSRGSN